MTEPVFGLVASVELEVTHADESPATADEPKE